MFDLRKAISGKIAEALPFDNLWAVFSRIRREHLSQLSPEIKTYDLFLFALRQGLIVENSDGKFEYGNNWVPE